MHESLDEFRFWPETDTNTRVICPCASEKLPYNVVTTLAPSFLIGSSSYLQVTRTFITRDENLPLFRGFPLFWLQFAEIYCVRFDTTCWNLIHFQGGRGGFLFLDRISSVLKNSCSHPCYNISDKFEIRPDRTKDCGVSCPWGSGKIPIDL